MLCPLPGQYCCVPLKDRIAVYLSRTVFCVPQDIILCPLPGQCCSVPLKDSIVVYLSRIVFCVPHQDMLCPLPGQYCSVPLKDNIVLYLTRTLYCVPYRGNIALDFSGTFCVPRQDIILCPVLGQCCSVPHQDIKLCPLLGQYSVPQRQLCTSPAQYFVYLSRTVFCVPLKDSIALYLLRTL